MRFILGAVGLGLLGIGLYGLAAPKRGARSEIKPEVGDLRAPSAPDFEARLAAVEPPGATMLSGGEFRAALEALLQAARERGESFVDVSSGQLHRLVGGYPGPNHRMPTCCSVMRGMLKKGDLVLNEPRRGAGARLLLRYHLAPPP